MVLTWTGQRHAGGLLYLAYRDLATLPNGGAVIALEGGRFKANAAPDAGVDLGDYATAEDAAGAVEAYGTSYDYRALKAYRKGLQARDRMVQ